MKYTISILSVLYFSTLCFAGILQGGGGGPQNIEIRRYLDKRHYALGGGAKQVVPGINVVNACRHDGETKTIHTINKIWVCEEFVEGKKGNKKCKSKKKKHYFKERPVKIKTCKTSETRVVPGVGLKQVCADEKKVIMKDFPMTYKLDVYKRNIGEGGSALYPKVDKDEFIKTIKYAIPNCTDVVAD